MSEERKKILNMLADGKISAEDAGKLLDALSGTKENPKISKEDNQRYWEEGKAPSNLRIKVLSGSGDNVNIKIPIKLIKAGAKLSGVLPDSVKDKVQSKLGDKGFGINLNDLNGDNLNSLLSVLTESEIKIIDKDEVVKIYCE